ncbi:unnamed protein product [Camellia sinensis]
MCGAIKEIRVEMAAESNTGFRHGGTFGSPFSRHAISFQSGAINSTSDMIPMANYYGINSTAGMVFSGNSSIINNNPGMTQAGSSSGSFLLDSVPGLKHDADMAAEWSVEEQQRLEEGLDNTLDLIHKFIGVNTKGWPMGVMFPPHDFVVGQMMLFVGPDRQRPRQLFPYMIEVYAAEPSIMKYIKIAAMLNDKDVRAVALRCRWMTRKKRKCDDQNLGKKVKDRKDKLVASSSKINISSASLLNMAPYSLIPNHLDHNEHMHFEGWLDDNIDLFFRARNNIAVILKDMREMPGIMRRMPPLPETINEELANSIFPSTSQQGNDVRLIKWSPLETGAPMLMACSILEVEFDLSLYV